MLGGLEHRTLIAAVRRAQSRDLVNVMTYGAVDGAPDNATAFELAAAAASGRQLYVPKGTFHLSRAVALGSVLGVVGDGPQSVIRTNGNTAFTVSSSKVWFKQVRWDSQATGAGVDYAVQATNVDQVRFERCQFGRVKIQVAGDTNAFCTNLKVLNNDFDGDYTGASGADTYNILDLRAVQDVQIRGNSFNCTKPYRFMKISCALNTYTDANTVSTYRSRYVDVIGNTIRGTMDSGKQIIDLFAGTSEVTVKGNIVEVTGTLSDFIEAKPGIVGDSEPQAATSDSIVVEGNTIYLSGTISAGAITLQGSWGLAWETGTIKCAVVNNVITELGSSAVGTIDVRGYNYAEITGNTIVKTTGTSFGKSITAHNNKVVHVERNRTNYGYFYLVGNASNLSGGTYTKNPETIVVRGNVIDDFVANYAIQFDTITGAKRIVVADNVIRNLTDSGTIAGALQFTSVTVDVAHVHDNSAEMAAAAKDKISVSASTLTKRVEHDNSWNVTTFTWDPANLVDGAGETSAAVTLTGAGFGAQVEVAAPYDIQGILCTAWVSAADTVKARLQNETGGAIDLASGTWRASYKWL